MTLPEQAMKRVREIAEDKAVESGLFPSRAKWFTDAILAALSDPVILREIENAAFERAWPEEPPREWLQAMAGEPLLLAASDEQALRHIYDDLRESAIRALKG